MMDIEILDLRTQLLMKKIHWVPDPLLDAQKRYVYGKTKLKAA